MGKNSPKFLVVATKISLIKKSIHTKKRGVNTKPNEDQKMENRKLALDYVKDELANATPEEMKTLSKKMYEQNLYINEKTFTAEELVKEAEKGSCEGNMFLDMIYGSILKPKKDEDESQESGQK